MPRSGTIDRLLIALAALCVLGMPGCCTAPASGIDPTGEHVFVAPPAPLGTDRSNERYFDHPLGQLPCDDVAVDLEPRETVASVGAEVVLIAGVCGHDGYLRTNRRLEWSIDPGGVGQFVDIGKTGVVDVLLGDFNRPRKITNTFAIGSTLRSNTRLNRGACIAEENVYVLRGQGWISLTSPVEGTSHVTVFAPEVYRWDARLKSAMVHWVDAQWRFPPPAINPAGSKHVFTTTVLRQSNQAPCVNWRVRYEIADGPPAGFMPDGATAIEVPTDPAGQASVEIMQKEPRHGTNKVSIQVIRPAELPGSAGRRLVVGSGTTLKTWTGADLAVTKCGPAVANVGATLKYCIEVSNPGDLPAKEVTVTDAVPDGLTFVGSNPQPTVAGGQLQWRLGDLGGRQRVSIDLSFRADKPGSVANCCEVVTANGLKASSCATTTIAAASVPATGPTATTPLATRPSSAIAINIVGPEQAAVGSQVTYEISVRNLSPSPATNLMIRDRLDAGLEHPAVNSRNAIERSLGDLAPGAAKPLSVTMRVAHVGRLCHTVEVTGPNVAASSKQACLLAVAASGTPGPGTPPATDTRPAASAITVKKTGPKQVLVDEMARFTIDITNTGTVAARNVRVVDQYDATMVPSLATDGFKAEAGTLVWTIPEILPGKIARLEVQCTCKSPAAKACNRVSVTAPDGTRAQDEACLEIRPSTAPPSSQPSPNLPATNPPPSAPPVTKQAAPAPSGLTMSVAGLSNPVTVGRSLTYEIRVTNTGSAPYKDVKLAAIVPDGMTPDPLGTVGPDGTNFATKGKTLTFDPVRELATGKPLVYYVRVQTRKAGKLQFRAEVTASGMTDPVVKETPTDVNEPRK